MSNLHTGAFTNDAIQTGMAIPPAAAPSPMRAFQLSLPAGGFPVPQTDDCLCDSTMRDMYSAYRTFGTPAMRHITQGQGDVPPVQRKLDAPAVPGAVPMKMQFMNYKPLEAAVDGRHVTCGAPGNYRDELLGGFGPSARYGFTAAPVRPEQVLQTVSIGLSTPRGGEMLNPRPFIPIMQPSMMSLTPVSEAAATRAENACRLNRMQQALVAQKLAAAMA